MSLDEIKACSICGALYTGWGNNAAPFPGRCCDDCERRAVLPFRIAMLQLQDGRRKRRQQTEKREDRRHG